MKTPLYLIGALTGNLLFFGWFDSPEQARQAGETYGETETACGFFVGKPCLVMP